MSGLPAFLLAYMFTFAQAEPNPHHPHKSLLATL